ncbi:MAG: OmpH family outer membrane protein [Thermotogota bacterium]
MSRNTLFIVLACVALVLAAAALVVPFVVPSKGENAPQAPAAKGSPTGFKVGFVNVDSAGTVFLNAVSDLRERSAAKAKEITDLQVAYSTGTVKEDQFQKQASVLSAELVEVNISVYATLLDRMIASSAFSDVRSSLQQVRQQAQPLVDDARNLSSMVKRGVMSTSEFQMRLSQTQAGYSQLEKLANQVLTLKIQQAAVKIATAKGLDLVLQQNGVVLYPGPSASMDLTEAVKAEIANYL